MATDYKIVVVPIRGAFDHASHAPRIGTTTITYIHIHTFIQFLGRLLVSVRRSRYNSYKESL